MTLIRLNIRAISLVSVLLSGALVSVAVYAKYSPLDEIKKVGFHGRVHSWNNITHKSHNIRVTVPSNAPVIVSDYHSPVGANGLRRSGFHQGIDIYAPIGSPIIAAADGQVLKAKVDRCWGPTMLLSHGKGKDGRLIYGLYGHVKNYKVRVGQRVLRGQQIAEMGDPIFNSCGAGFNHLHFQVSHSAKSIPLFGWGWANFVGDGGFAPNPHKYWVNGKGNVTCFDASKRYEKMGFTYPVPCKNTPNRSRKVTIVAAEKSSIQALSVSQEVMQDEIIEFLNNELVAIIPEPLSQTVSPLLSKPSALTDLWVQEFNKVLKEHETNFKQ